ncbi:MAG: hypothetical protein J0I93_00410 [Legionella sp.]|nr:hypothetical protein [Legionella sp.]
MRIDLDQHLNTPILSWPELKAKIRAFEAVITSVSLRHYPLQRLDSFQIQELGHLLGPAVHTIDLSGALAQFNEPASTLALFLILFPKLKTLKLADNEFYKLSPDSWLNLLAILPKSIQKLDLQNNLLHEKVLGLNTFPYSFLELNLSNNALNEITNDTLSFCQNVYAIQCLNLSCNQFRTLPDWRSKNVTQLRLNNARLDQLTASEFYALCEHLPQSLQILDLEENNLGALAAEVLQKGFSLLPKTLVYINLKKNGLNQQKGSELKIAFSGVLENVKGIDLSENNLASIDGHGLKVALSGLHKFIKFISLAGNALHSLEIKKLTEAFKSLTRNDSVVQIDLQDNIINENGLRLPLENVIYLQKNLPVKVDLIFSKNLNIRFNGSIFFKSTPVKPPTTDKNKCQFIQCITIFRAFNQQNLPLELILHILSYVAPQPVVNNACTFYHSNLLL